MAKFKKIIEYGLYLLVFLLPWQTRLIITEGNINGFVSEYQRLSLYGIDILLGLVALLLLVYKIKNRKYFTPKKIKFHWWLLGILELSYFISIFISIDKVVAVYAYARFFFAIILFWLVLNIDYKRMKLLGSFLCGAFLTALLGVWQFVLQLAYANKWLGLAWHDPIVSGTSVVEAMGSLGYGERWLRAYGSFDHPNILGGYMAISIIVLIWYFINKDKRNRQKKSEYNIENLIKNIFIYIFFIIYFLAMFFSFSRSAWIGLVVGIICLLFLAVIKKDFLAQNNILKLLFVGILLSGLMYSSFGNLVQARFAGKGRLERISLNERINANIQAWNMIKKNWFLGVGAGNFTQALRMETTQEKPGYYYQPVHNTYLLIWSELGLVGALAFIGFLVLIAVKFIKDKKDSKYLLSAFSALIVMMFFDHWWWSLHFGIIFLFFAFSLIIKETS